MKFVAQNYEEVALDRLTPHPRNPRRGDLEAIGASVDANGWYGALVVQRSTGHILAGNHRYQVARRSGVASLPVLWVDVDDERALRILLADNRTNDLAGQQDSVLADLLAELAHLPAGLAGTGYDAPDLDRLLGNMNDSLPEAPPAGDQSDRLVERFQILIECGSEEEQRVLLDRFDGEGLRCRALVT